jgi:uncharacterized protein YndB with AHSA1/START domain
MPTMAATTDAAAIPAELELVITRVLDAPRSLVFKVWTQPEHVVRWLGPKGFTAPSCEMDLRPGGAWRACIRSPEGTEHRMQGVYREVAPPERLVFTFAWEDEQGAAGHQTLVTVTFAEQDGRTLLTVHQATFETVESRDSHHGGWSECFDRLAEYLASL